MSRRFLDDVAFSSRTTLGGPVSFGRNTTEVVVDIGDSGASATVDVAAGGMHTLTLNHNNCVLAFGGVDQEGERGASFALIVTHSGDDRWITWPENVEWPGTDGPDLSYNDGDVDVFTFVSPDGGGVWYGFGGAPGSTSSGVMLTGDQEISGIKTFEDVLNIAGNTAERVVNMGSSGSSADVDVSAGSIHLLSLNHNECVLSFTNIPEGEDGKSFVLIINHEGNGRGVQWPANVNWPAGEEPQLGHTSGDYDVFTFMSPDSGVTWYGFGGGGKSTPIDWELTAGDGLTGGGDLTENRTLAVDSSVARTALTLTAGDGLSGGGDLTDNRSFSVDDTVVRTAGAQTVSGAKRFDDTVTFAANTYVNNIVSHGEKAALFISAGTGTSAGGNIRLIDDGTGAIRNFGTTVASWGEDGFMVTRSNNVMLTEGNQTVGGIKSFNHLRSYAGTPADLNSFYGSDGRAGVGLADARNSSANSPENWTSIANFVHHEDRGFQIAMRYGAASSNAFYVRSLHDQTGEWNPWREVMISGVNQTITGNKTFSGTTNVTGTFILPVK